MASFKLGTSVTIQPFPRSFPSEAHSLSRRENTNEDSKGTDPFRSGSSPDGRSDELRCKRAVHIRCHQRVGRRREHDRYREYVGPLAHRGGRRQWSLQRWQPASRQLHREADQGWRHRRHTQHHRCSVIHHGCLVRCHDAVGCRSCRFPDAAYRRDPGRFAHGHHRRAVGQAADRS
ncbi:hypothetical protein D3C81_1156600 [compost metagenome]